jgi:hypothetical protein
MEACHLARKMLCAAFRRDNPNAYRAMRDAVARDQRYPAKKKRRNPFHW